MPVSQPYIEHEGPATKVALKELSTAQLGHGSSSLYDRDFEKNDILSLGDALTQNIYNSTSYTNPVYLLTGKQDAVFCGKGSRLFGYA